MTPDRMQRIAVTAYGEPAVLQVTEADVPEPLPTEVLIRVTSAGVNPVDCKTRAGAGMAGVLGPPPFGLGWDVCGVVAACGLGVTRFEIGDRVLGMPWFPRQAAAYAEFVTSPSRQVVRAPRQLSDPAAGGLPLAGLTAWQALVETAGAGKGDRVLIAGGSGGVGHLAVQIAKARGAWVAATARADNHAFLKSLGADETIDYESSSVGAELRGSVDVVMDLVGGEFGRSAIDALRSAGTYIVIPSRDTENAAFANSRGHRAPTLLVEPDRAGLEELVNLIESGELRVEIAQEFALAEAADAHVALEQGHIRGKLVLRP